MPVTDTQKEDRNVSSHGVASYGTLGHVPPRLPTV